jgi:hypothetical protein
VSQYGVFRLKPACWVERRDQQVEEQEQRDHRTRRPLAPRSGLSVRVGARLAGKSRNKRLCRGVPHQVGTRRDPERQRCARAICHAVRPCVSRSLSPHQCWAFRLLPRASPKAQRSRRVIRIIQMVVSVAVIVDNSNHRPLARWWSEIFTRTAGAPFTSRGDGDAVP